MLAGTMATLGLLLTREITAPPEGAGALSVTVPVEAEPPLTLVGLSVNELKVGNIAGVEVGVGDDTGIDVDVGDDIGIEVGVELMSILISMLASMSVTKHLSTMCR